MSAATLQRGRKTPSDRWHGPRGALTCTPGRALAGRPPARPSVRPSVSPSVRPPAGRRFPGCTAARGQRRRRPSRTSRSSPPHAGSPLRRSPPRAPPPAPGSRLFTHACSPLLHDQDGGGGRAQRSAGAGQAWRERLEPIQRAVARRAARWPAARPRPRPRPPEHLAGRVSPPAGD